MICYSAPTNSDVELSSMKKGHNSSSSTTTTYYDRNHEQDWCKVVTTQPDSSLPAQHQHHPREERTYMGLAVVVCVCFNIPLGLLAVYLSSRANKAVQKGATRRARLQARLSLVLSVLGIVSTLTAVLLVVFWPAIVQQQQYQQEQQEQQYQEQQTQGEGSGGT